MERTIAEIQQQMADGALSAVALARACLDRIEAIDRSGPALNAVIEIDPAALERAAALDAERARRGPRSPLHGVPILLKDNIDTGAMQPGAMQTSAGSLALVGEPAPEDATVAARLRAAGALLLGKTNLSEWANFRALRSSSGWSGRGGLTRNPYALDRNPSGSSSGSAAAVAANLCAAALGTETDGSVVSPANACGVVGLKPTVGLTSRAGVVPISATQDSVGVHARSVADAAALLGVLAGPDPRDPATAASAPHAHADYSQFLDPAALANARIGVARNAGLWGYSTAADAVGEEALAALRRAGATLLDPLDLPAPAADPAADFDEMVVLLYEFRRDLNAYLATRRGVPARTLADVIAFNRAHAAEELCYFGQELMEIAESGIVSAAAYATALERSRRSSGPEGVDALLDAHGLDALVAPTGAPAWLTDLVNGDAHQGGVSSLAARCGYPLISVPAGAWGGLPVGITFIGRAWSEPLLLRLAFAFEQATQARRAFGPPQFHPTLPSGALARPPEQRIAAGSVQRHLEPLRAQPPALPRHAFLAGLSAHLAARQPNEQP